MDDIYTVTATTNGLGWVDISTVPASISVPSGQTTTIDVTVTHPSGETGQEMVKIHVISQGDPGFQDAATTEINSLWAIYLPLVIR